MQLPCLARRSVPAPSIFLLEARPGAASELQLEAPIFSATWGPNETERARAGC